MPRASLSLRGASRVPDPPLDSANADVHHLAMTNSQRLIRGGLLVLLAAGCRGMQPPAGDDTAEILRLEHEWAQAAVDHDADKMANDMADDYVEIALNPASPGKSAYWSTVNKADWVADVRSGKDQYESVVLRDLTVRLQGDIATVTGYYSQKGTSGGKDISATGAYVNTWVRRGGRWLVMNSVFP